MTVVYIVSDETYGVGHAFSNREAAEDYIEWEEDFSHGHHFISEVELFDSWDPPLLVVSVVSQ